MNRLSPADDAAKPTTYQEALDEAIEETFPASDPISPAVERAREPISTRRNRTDWKLAHDDPAVQEGEADLDDILRALKTGLGRERVTDANVGALIELARERGETRIELLLREWRSPCGDDPDMPTA